MKSTGYELFFSSRFYLKKDCLLYLFLLTNTLTYDNMYSTIEINGGGQTREGIKMTKGQNIGQDQPCMKCNKMIFWYADCYFHNNDLEIFCIACGDKMKRERANKLQRERHEAYTSLGLKRVKGALGGTYYE